MRLIRFTPLVFVFWSCDFTKSPDQKDNSSTVINHLIDIRYVGEDRDNYYRLVVSDYELSKSHVLHLGSLGKNEGCTLVDSFWVKTIRVPCKILKKMKIYLDDNLSTDRSVLDEEVDYNESPIVGYEFRYFQQDSLSKEYWCVTNPTCKQKFYGLVDLLKKEEFTDSLLSLLESYYIVELENPGWGNVQRRIERNRMNN
ncbi:MAG: hypothetical protein AAF693_21495 [Bacteroidota bacterium]